MNKRALIFGVAGQDGAYLSRLLLEKGYSVDGTSRDAAANEFRGLAAHGLTGKIDLHSLDLTDPQRVAAMIESARPDEIYNLSAQSSVGLSFEQPIHTLASIGNATLNILEAIRKSGSAVRFYNASSSEMFGDTGGKPATETNAFRPHSPYGVAKAAAHWLVENYRKGYGLYACSGICFNHESPLRGDRFVTRKIVRSAVDISRGAKQRLALGNVSIVRDWGWAPDYVDAMWRMLQQPDAEDFVIATGRGTALSDFAEAAFRALGLDWRDHVDQDSSLLRPHDLAYSVGDAGRAMTALKWTPTVLMPQIVQRLVDAERARA